MTARKEIPKKAGRPALSAKEKLRKILGPFAEWAWGPEDGPKVVEKYFRQRPIKESE